MGYRCGVGFGMHRLGMEPREAHVFCDGCGVTHAVHTRESFAAKWFLSRRPPPGWRGVRMHDGTKRWDLCPKCWKGDT